MQHTLPSLDFATDALEPHIDAQTMEIHHGKHHQTYVAGLNAALEGNDTLAALNVDDLIQDLSSIPEGIRGAVRNHGGGHSNHSFFWKAISPSGGGLPSGELGSAIDSTFGNFDALKEAFTKAALTRFGSGWAWLVKNADGSLAVTKTENGVNPLCFGQTALLGCDVWEHSYYIDFRNKRPVYLSNFLDKLVNWENVASRM